MCTVDRRNRLRLDVGRPGRNDRISKARDGFLELVAGRSREFDLPRDTQDVAGLLRELAISRRTGKLAAVQTEHHLESRILRGDVTLDIDGVGRLEPLTDEAPFQFPTCWTRGGDARYVDVLMRQGSTPWVIELKVDSGGQASYYRGGISQAVLYRQFIRNAVLLHPWFDDHGLKEHDCRAALVVPYFLGSRRDRLLDDLQVAARDFGIEVRTIA